MITHRSTTFDNTSDDFCYNIKHRTRFFSKVAAHRLEEIFEGVERFRASDDRLAIREIKPGDMEATVNRARWFDTERDLLDVYLNPAQGLGPPPAKKATANRMNPVGIPVFYGAFDWATCVSEIRPPVGAVAVVCSFQLIRPIRVLDFTVLDKAFMDASYFDPLFSQKVDQRAFLTGFHKEISKPVLPIYEPLEFIPTQVVAEYLAHRFQPQLDGVLYASTQTEGQGINIALFNHAALVEGVSELSLSEDQERQVAAQLDEGSFTISKIRRPRAHSKQEKTGRLHIMPPDHELDLMRPTPDMVRAPTLRYVEGSVEFHRVVSVTHRASPLRILDMRKQDGLPDF